MTLKRAIKVLRKDKLMKQRYKSRLQKLIVVSWFLALLYVYGIAGALQWDRITFGQAVLSGAVGLAYVVISGLTYTYLGKEERW